MKYEDYVKQVMNDAVSWLNDNELDYDDWYDACYICKTEVTGSICGRYYCNRHSAAKACSDMIWDISFRGYLSGIGMTVPTDPETCDVLVRRWVFDNIASELEDYFDDLKALRI